MLRIAAGDRMVFQLAEAAREGHMLGARDVLIAQEQHAMLRAGPLGSRANRPSSWMASARLTPDQFGADARR